MSNMGYCRFRNTDNDLDTMVLEIVTYLTDHDLKVIRIIKGE